jgi:hypothetical protein
MRNKECPHLPTFVSLSALPAGSASELARLLLTNPTDPFGLQGRNPWLGVGGKDYAASF